MPQNAIKTHYTYTSAHIAHSKARQRPGRRYPSQTTRQAVSVSQRVAYAAGDSKDAAPRKIPRLGAEATGNARSPAS